MMMCNVRRSMRVFIIRFALEYDTIVDFYRSKSPEEAVSVLTCSCIVTTQPD